jgi:hypothetical protein
MRRMAALAGILGLALIGACKPSITDLNSGAQPHVQGADPKVCLEDIRQLDLVSPTEGELTAIRTGQQVYVSWEPINTCGPFVTTVRITVGTTEQEFTMPPNAKSFVWTAPWLGSSRCGRSQAIVVAIDGYDRIGLLRGEGIGVQPVYDCPEPPIHGQEHD